MNKRMIFAVILGFGAVASASTITEPLTTVTGQSYTVVSTAFAVDGDQMAGMKISATFAGGGTDTCTWATGSPNAGCTGIGGDFSLLFPHLQDTDPDTSGANGIWTLTNLDTNTLTSLTVDAVIGGVSFDRCLLASGFDDTNNNISVCDTAHGGLEGTPGTAEGWTVNNANGGTSGITASATYFDVLHTSGQAPILDAWGEMTLNFAGTTTFATSDTFTYRADTDLVTASADVPEPATMGLLGLGLLGLGALRLRKR
jgi:hypothetical protein